MCFGSIGYLEENFSIADYDMDGFLVRKSDEGIRAVLPQQPINVAQEVYS